MPASEVGAPLGVGVGVNEEPVDGLAGWTVAKVLARMPDRAMAFIRLRTACVGCPLDRFCTLADVASAYHIPLATLVDAVATTGDEADEDPAHVGSEADP